MGSTPRPEQRCLLFFRREGCELEHVRTPNRERIARGFSFARGSRGSATGETSLPRELSA